MAGLAQKNSETVNPEVAALPQEALTRPTREKAPTLKT